MSQLFSTCFLNPLALELLQIMAQSTGTFFIFQIMSQPAIGSPDSASIISSETEGQRHGGDAREEDPGTGRPELDEADRGSRGDD